MKQAMDSLKYIEEPKYTQIKKISKDLDISERYVYKALANVRYKRGLNETTYLKYLKKLIDFMNEECYPKRLLTDEEVKEFNDIGDLVKKKLNKL